MCVFVNSDLTRFMRYSGQKITVVKGVFVNSDLTTFTKYSGQKFTVVACLLAAA